MLANDFFSPLKKIICHTKEAGQCLTQSCLIYWLYNMLCFFALCRRHVQNGYSLLIWFTALLFITFITLLGTFVCVCMCLHLCVHACIVLGTCVGQRKHSVVGSSLLPHGLGFELRLLGFYWSHQSFTYSSLAIGIHSRSNVLLLLFPSFFFFSNLEIEPRASHKWFTTELYP